MPRKIVDTILPTTMVGSYPRPRWFGQQLLGRDVRVAFKEASHEEAYHDATHSVLHDQEEAGLDIVTDGQMSYDDYVAYRSMDALRSAGLVRSEGKEYVMREGDVVNFRFNV